MRRPNCPSRQVLFICLAAFVAVAAACSGENTAGPGAAGATKDTGFGSFEIIGGTDVAAGADAPLGEPDSGVAADGEADVAPIEHAFGAPCIENKDCDSGLCVPSPNGLICTQTCVENCPVGFKCTLKTSGTDSSYICLASFGTLCDPCQQHADCNIDGQTGNLCISFGSDGSFCGAECGAGKATCPADYDCSAVVDPETGKAAKQCQPKNLLCKCSPAAVAKSAKTSCSNKNLYGVCNGVRSCTGAGLGECQASVPKPEECNGVDDDCNGKPDDFDVTAKCFNTSKFGKCPGVLTACVDGVALCDAPTPTVEQCNGLDDDCDGSTDNVTSCEDGESCTKDACNSGGGCQHTPQSGAACDDGNSCTQEDKCSQGACTGGKPLGCDDGDACSLDGCDALGGCVHTPQDGACTDDGEACTQDVCKAGKCSHPPTAEGGACLDDGDVCSQDVCVAGKCTHPQIKDTTPCADDGNPCTADACAGGKCAHPPVSFTLPCAEDANECTADVCDKGGCTHQPLGANKACTLDTNPCTQDLCILGECKHPAAANNAPCEDDGLGCTNDICVGGKCDHPPVNGKPCAEDGDPCTQDICQDKKCSHPGTTGNVPCADDGVACTKDVCQAGLCKHVNQNAPCDDLDPCTLIDVCDSASGLCKGANKPNCNDNNECTADSCKPGQGCIHEATGNFCNDGNACTTGDKCLGTQCAGVPNKNCDDGNPCTTDGCDTGCTHVNNAAPCADDGNACTSDACANGGCGHPSIASGAPCDNKDNNPCADGVCQGGVCKSQNNANVCNDGNVCTSNDKCVNGACEGTAFKDCNDGNPCTQDSCDKNGACTHQPISATACVAPSGDCPVGTCSGGTCLSTPGVTCQAKQKTDLCGSVLVPGTCSGSGKCVSSTAAPGFSCPGCNGICVACTIFGGFQIKYCLAF